MTMMICIHAGYEGPPLEQSIPTELTMVHSQTDEVAWFIIYELKNSCAAQKVQEVAKPIVLAYKLLKKLNKL